METDNLDRIAAFIRRHHVLTLATARDGQPWCSNMFYAWVPEARCLVFTSDGDTRHICEAVADSRVAASIVLETRIVGRVQGLQIEGTLTPAAGSPMASRARKSYLKRFPYAAAAELKLWMLTPSMMKLTDNTLGFGKKLVWHADGGK